MNYKTSIAIVLLALTACGKDHSSNSPAFVIIGALNDTGLVHCASTGAAALDCPQVELPGQDGDLGRDALAEKGALVKEGGGVAGFDWSKLAADGSLLSIQNGAWQAEGEEVDGTRWSCIRDNTTGLDWEVKESNPEHPRYGGLTYNWFSSDMTDNGGFSGAEMLDNEQCPTSPCNTEHYVAWVNEQGLCGANDWRLPSIRELMSIAVYAKVLPALDTDFFPNSPHPRFFTNQTRANDPSLAWYVYFTDATVSSTNKSDRSYVRLVRGGLQ